MKHVPKFFIVVLSVATISMFALWYPSLYVTALDTPSPSPYPYSSPYSPPPYYTPGTGGTPPTTYQPPSVTPSPSFVPTPPPTASPQSQPTTQPTYSQPTPSNAPHPGTSPGAPTNTWQPSGPMPMDHGFPGNPGTYQPNVPNPAGFTPGGQPPPFIALPPPITSTELVHKVNDAELDKCGRAAATAAGDELFKKLQSCFQFKLGGSPDNAPQASGGNQPPPFTITTTFVNRFINNLLPPPGPADCVGKNKNLPPDQLAKTCFSLVQFNLVPFTPQIDTNSDCGKLLASFKSDQAMTEEERSCFETVGVKTKLVSLDPFSTDIKKHPEIPNCIKKTFGGKLPSPAEFHALSKDKLDLVKGCVGIAPPVTDITINSTTTKVAVSNVPPIPSLLFACAQKVVTDTAKLTAAIVQSGSLTDDQKASIRKCTNDAVKTIKSPELQFASQALPPNLLLLAAAKEAKPEELKLDSPQVNPSSPTDVKVTIKSQANTSVHFFSFSDPVVATVGTDGNGIAEYHPQGLAAGDHKVIATTYDTNGDTIRTQAVSFSIAKPKTAKAAPLSITPGPAQKTYSIPSSGSNFGTLYFVAGIICFILLLLAIWWHYHNHRRENQV